MGGAYRLRYDAKWPLMVGLCHLARSRKPLGPQKEIRPGSRRGSVSDGWLPIQCCSEGKSCVVISWPL